VIATGRVVGILREAYTSINASTYAQHTVYVVAVEKYLKSSDPAMPPLLKMWQVGGSLPWSNTSGNVEGAAGYEFIGDPMLILNARYLLFLKLPEGNFSKLGSVPATADGVRGKCRELDEYLAIEPWQGKILLKNGLTCAPSKTGGSPHWRFYEEPQILDTIEEFAITTVQEQISRGE
jgi:hypothetical protein